MGIISRRVVTLDELARTSYVIEIIIKNTSQPSWPSETWGVWKKGLIFRNGVQLANTQCRGSLPGTACGTQSFLFSLPKNTFPKPSMGLDDDHGFKDMAVLSALIQIILNLKA